MIPEMITPYIPYILFWALSLVTLFLYLTAISGVKFYETRLQRDDVKNVKIVIHICGLIATGILSFVLYKGYLNVSNDKATPHIEKTEKVEEAKPTE